MKKKTGKKISTRQMAACALMAVAMCVCSWISVPTPVPFTMQTFAVFAALLLLGGRLGLISIVVYVLLGAVGLPVFSGFTGGIGRLIGPTGGYILGFFIMGLVYWLLERRCESSRVKKILSLVLGLLLCYAFGTAWFVRVYALGGGAISLGGALMACVVPFIVPDAIKLALAMWVAEMLKKYIIY